MFPEFLAWFANYLVVKRAAQEANYHTLYIALCDKVWFILTKSSRAA